jgi:hypothetical protein
MTAFLFVEQCDVALLPLRRASRPDAVELWVSTAIPGMLAVLMLPAINAVPFRQPAPGHLARRFLRRLSPRLEFDIGPAVHRSLGNRADGKVFDDHEIRWPLGSRPAR